MSCFSCILKFLVHKFKHNFFVDTVYFIPGIKHPKMVIAGDEFKIHRRTESRSFWACTQHAKYRCKIRAFTTGQKVFIKEGKHTHSRKYNDMTVLDNNPNIPRKQVFLSYTDNFHFK